MEAQGNSFLKVGLIGVIRLVAGAAQFIIIVLITASLGIDEVGHYTLFIIYLNYAVQIGGLSFYTYFVRIVPTIAQSDLASILYQIWVALLITVAPTILGAALLASVDILQISSLASLCFLILLTIFNTQHENFFVAIQAPVAAASLLLVRSVWVYLVAFAHILDVFDLSLEIILGFWLVNEFIAATIVLINLHIMRVLPRRINSIDFNWIKRGYRSGVRYTILGFLLLVSISSQRLLLSSYAGEKEVGIFQFYYAVSVFGPNLLEATIYAVILPRIIREAANGNGSLQAPKRELLAFMVISSIVGLSILYTILPFFIDLLGRPELAASFDVVLATISFAVLYNLSRCFHYQLYAAAADDWILGAYALSALVGCGTSFLLIPTYGLAGASWSLVCTGMAMLVGLCLPFVLRFKPPIGGRVEDK